MANKTYPEEKDFILQLLDQAVAVDFADDPPVNAKGEAVFEKKDEILARQPLNDLGNAHRLMRRYGDDIIYVDEIGWLIWTGTHWSEEQGFFKARLKAHETARRLRRECLATINKGPIENEFMEDFEKRVGRFKKFSLESGNAGRLNAMLDVAQSYCARGADDLDTHHYKITVANGTLDLKPDPAALKNYDGDEIFPVILQKHDRKDLMTQCVNATYDPQADCPNFRQFIQDILPDKNLQNFMQRFFGYCLTGVVSEQIILMLWGKEGSNGKSTLMDLMAFILGDCAKGVPIKSLMANDRGGGEKASPDLARLRSVRFVTTAEPETGDRFSETIIKQITGEERMTVRNLNKGYFEFYPNFKLVVSFNNKPNVRSIDMGFWRRICLVPFNQVFVDADKIDSVPGAKLKKEGLKELLQGERNGILNWMLDGFRLWRESGLQIPDSVRAATAEYRKEANPVLAFIEDCCERSDQDAETATDLYIAYELWCSDNGLDPMSTTMFGRKCSDMGLEKRKSGVISYKGVKLSGDWTDKVAFKKSGRKAFDGEGVR